MPPLSAHDGFAPMFAFGAASQSPPAGAHWVVSPSSPSSRRSSTSFALPNGNTLHPLPSGLSHNNDGRPRSASTPFVSYQYGSGHTRPAGFALSSERGSSGPEVEGVQAAADGRWSPPIPEDFSRPRSVSIPTNVEQASYRTHRTGSSSFAKLPSMSEYEQELPQPPISVRHPSHPAFAGHASAVPRLAFLGPSDSPSALSSATTDEDELPLPNGYPFKDPTYRPVHPSAAMGMRQVPHLQTTNLGSALSLPPPPMMPASLPSGLAHIGPGFPPTSESSAPSPMSAPGPAIAASPRSQARPSSKRGRLSLTSNEDPDALPIPPPTNPKETMASPTDGTPSENGRYTCPHCPKRFARPSSLRIHMHSHTGEKPFTCNLCDRAFSVQSNLRRHLKIHRGPASGGDTLAPKVTTHPVAPHLEIPEAGAGDGEGEVASATSDSTGPSSAVSLSSAVSSETTASRSSLDSLPTPVDAPRAPIAVLTAMGGQKPAIFDEREEDAAVMASPIELEPRALA